MAFLDYDYLLTGETSRKLFASIEKLPVIDPHNHADLAEVAANCNYQNPWQLFAATDHYVWELLRKCAVPEAFITGDREPEEKFLKLAEVFPRLVGNPVQENNRFVLRNQGGAVEFFHRQHDAEKAIHIRIDAELLVIQEQDFTVVARSALLERVVENSGKAGEHVLCRLRNAGDPYSGPWAGRLTEGGVSDVGTDSRPAEDSPLPLQLGESLPHRHPARLKGQGELLF